LHELALDPQAIAQALDAACRPGAKPTKTKAVSWQESADVFWEHCLELQAADRARRATESATMN
jgi:hypothetical protein